MDSKTLQLLQRNLSNSSKKSASIFPPLEAFLKFILECKNTKSIAFHDFTHFCIFRESVFLEKLQSGRVWWYNIGDKETYRNNWSIILYVIQRWKYNFSQKTATTLDQARPGARVLTIV
jgi:hypothetical protein